MICELCKTRQATEIHHKFPQGTTGKRANKKVYPDYIHHPDNLMRLCYNCHHNKSLEKWTEKQFCDHFGIEPRSKSGRQKWVK
jgi:hypothetical protein